jgi:hypothetical protein
MVLTEPYIARTKGSPGHEAKAKVGLYPGTKVPPTRHTAPQLLLDVMAREHTAALAEDLFLFPSSDCMAIPFLVRLTSHKHPVSFAVLILDAV